ncbi:response regulator transcription factor [Leucobacter sp. UCMA 4100]|uniref:response regulator transcription factor n=1 Tax=Leucobacter sp. UCMA 4100 TaxID=2810534 RepID=UPI0022EAD412|nr:response regulator transcription factor [Leucobacter sp. UCMA 4100]MDA3146252.1 response regulator transcription factor [Leucobacter sp. UCMA 4100]
MVSAERQRTKLLIVDDQALVRGALGALLDLEEDFEVVAYATDGAEALRQIEAYAPDVCLMDIQMGGNDGIAATQRISEQYPHVAVLIVTTFARPGYVNEALAAGAKGFIVKDAAPEALAEAIRRVRAGLRTIDPALAETTLFASTNPLSDRERHILRLAGEGNNAPSIAAEVFLSAGTVRNHLSSIIQKLGVDNRAQAFALASQRGWL